MEIDEGSHNQRTFICFWMTSQKLRKPICNFCPYGPWPLAIFYIYTVLTFVSLMWPCFPSTYFQLGRPPAVLSTETWESTTEDQLKPSPDHSHHIPYAQPQSQQDSDVEITFPCRKISWEVKGKRKRPKSIATRKTPTRPVKQKKFVDDFDEDEPLPKSFGKPPVKQKKPRIVTLT